MGKTITNEKGFDPDKKPDWLSAFWGKKKYRNVLAGINDDDCAVLKVGSEQIVVSVDYLNSKPIALELGIGAFKDLGKLLVAANLSDLCGSGAKPIGFLVSVMLKKETANNEDFENLMMGIKQELLKHNVPLVGGDTKLGTSNNFCGIAIGVKEKGTKLFLKNKARPGDNIWVSGNIGSVAAAIDGLKNHSTNGTWKKWAIKRIITPDLPLKKSRLIAKSKAANGGTDLSDGLGSDLLSLCQASGVGAVIDAGKIPLARQVKEIAKEKSLEAWKYAFTIGGDFQFMVTTKPNKKLSKYGFKKIGRICKEKKLSLKINDRLYDLPTKGHRDFKIVDFSDEVTSLISNINLIS